MSVFTEIFHSDRILEIRMQSNEKNTFDFQAFSDFKNLLAKHAQSKTLRVLLFTSGTEGYFSNGIEPSLMIGKSHDEVEKAVSLLIGTALDYFLFPVPTISLLSGHTMAAGAVFALFSDFRFMVDKGARIGFSEALVGLNFPSFPTMVLADLVGQKNARDLLYTGKQIKGKEALEIGLIDELVSPETIWTEGKKKADSLATLTFESARGIKTALRDYYRPVIDRVFSSDVANFTQTIQTPNGQEGFRSLIENRRPNFT